jgi:hypothetical protein
MRAVSRLFFLTLLGAVLGAVAATFVLPGTMVWYNSPGGTGQAALCPCADTAHNAISQLIRGQVIGAIVGAVVFLVIGILWMRRHPSASSVSPPASGA